MIEDYDYPSDDTLNQWPDCARSGCKNKCCKSLNSIYCYPHTEKEKKQKPITIETTNENNTN